MHLFLSSLFLFFNILFLLLFPSGSYFLTSPLNVSTFFFCCIQIFPFLLLPLLVFSIFFFRIISIASIVNYTFLSISLFSFFCSVSFSSFFSFLFTFLIFPLYCFFFYCNLLFLHISYFLSICFPPITPTLIFTCRFS